MIPDLESKETLSILNDPFLKDKVNRIFINIHKSFYTDKFNVLGSIEFKNGSTEGTQKFEAEDFDLLILQMKNFMQNLK